ncbi:MAG TPA: quinone-dependent dihydroorotate dehydrogenase, partial [Tepidisphaeraceae bacterium]|nr:quinone-dependent dihydroorotate dehydrogenase [Tepidisphaeraceae bacterium]
MLYDLLRPLLFTLPAERAHGVAAGVLRATLSTTQSRAIARSFFQVDDPALHSECFGIHFPNPIGLAAGFDKSGESFNPLAALGFGFIEIGTITAQAQTGNPRPRLFRLPTDRALLNRMGFNNPGAEVVAAHLRTSRIEPILGINIGKSRVVPLEQAADDYVRSLELLEPFAHYIVINVSSPNTPGLRSLQHADALRDLLTAIKSRATRPVLLKISPDLTDGELEEIVGVATDQAISGIIATNTTTSREGLQTSPEKIQSLGDGGISGAPLRIKAIQIVHRIYQLTHGKMPIVGVGGIFSADDAWAMICAGASLVQLYS